jgi:diketogulonate reductase-like aldo/keto reductase
MHCETTVDPEGTWQESWHALEKAYAEGRVNSIGVSNFNFELLEEMSEIATIRPHLVQNHAEPGAVDSAVRSWCDANNVVYQPYASLRNLASSTVLEPMKKLAAQHSVSEHIVALKFMIETNAVVIPRAKNVAHLKENLEVFDKTFVLTPSDMQSLGWVQTTSPSPSFEPF